MTHSRSSGTSMVSAFGIDPVLIWGRVTKLVGVGDDYPAVARCEADVQHECGSQVSATRSQPYYLVVTHPDANKGHVVTVLSQALSIPPAQIATIGDMPNDVFMFQKSGLSIARETRARTCNGTRNS